MNFGDFDMHISGTAVDPDAVAQQAGDEAPMSGSAARVGLFGAAAEIWLPGGFQAASRQRIAKCKAGPMPALFLSALVRPPYTAH
ncbi:hypothetical protein RM530_13065 [Algiphilus sp. W345]|uniref:Uncharacterized protein n=1 Tax=Banduia mediterranea TaxID=3075609 RepID=A0ABU2WK81_9GAMM|nr:hypothetical protein [Algiphilus sp. W345]MDT0498287.1 hypothetical protein [Algiphilus sp. W345]